jgi:hypothetical protein
MEDTQSGDDEATQGGVLRFLKDTWIWWLLPLLLVLGLAIALLWMSEGDATSPFIYDVF